MTDPSQMAISATMGFVFRQLAQASAQRHKEFMGAFKVKEKSMQAASERGGTWMRRFIALSIVGISLAVVYAGFSNHDVVLEYVLDRKFGPIQWEKVKHVTVQGVVMLEDNRSILQNLVSFYFGQGIKGK